MLNRRNFLNRGAQTLPILGVGMAGGLALSGCAGVSLEGYKSEKPVFSLREYFNGPIRAWGIFTDRSGQVQKRFTVEMNCSWSGEQGTLDESFFYSDGTRQRRIWHRHRITQPGIHAPAIFGLLPISIVHSLRVVDPRALHVPLGDQIDRINRRFSHGT